MNLPEYRIGHGIASKRFLSEDSRKPCCLGGVIFDDVPGLDSSSDGDVIFHALCNAVSSITSEPTDLSEELLENYGITDSSLYLQKALSLMKNFKISNVVITIEAKRPTIYPKIKELKISIAKVLQIEPTRIGITAISGDGLTEFGCGFGIHVQAFLHVYSY